MRPLDTQEHFPEHVAPPRLAANRLAFRLAIPAGALCLFGALALLWVLGFQPVYFDTLRLLGVDPYRFPFLDIHAALASADCYRQGIDVYLSNPCDVLGRVHAYSPLWLALTPSSWGTGATARVGTVLDLLFIFSLPILIRPRSISETFIFGLAVFSPMTVFALERVNNDVIIFLLILCGAALFLAPRPYRLGSYALFLFAGLLKYYPLVLLALMLRERSRSVLVPAILAAAVLILFAASYYADFGKMLANLPLAPYFTNAFSAKDLPYGFAGLLRDGPVLSHDVIALSVLSVLAIIALDRARRNFRLLATTTLHGSERDVSLLVMGSLLLTFCFFAGPNMDYRGIFFLFILPGLVRLRQSVDSATVRQWFSWLIAATLFVMWKEVLRHILYIALDPLPSENLHQLGEFLFWLGREFVWWWLITDLASIAMAQLWRMPLAQEGITGFHQLTALFASSLNRPRGSREVEIPLVATAEIGHRRHWLLGRYSLKPARR